MNAVIKPVITTEKETEYQGEFDKLLDKPVTNHAIDFMFDDGLFSKAERLAEIMSRGTIMMPKHLHGKHADCFAVAIQALQWGLNPFVVAQKTYLVNGTLGYEAQLIIAIAQASGAIRGSFKYEFNGDSQNFSCRSGAVLNGENEITWGEWLDVASVATKNSPLWKTNPRQQMAYLQARNWTRMYAPGAILGVYTPDELEHQNIPNVDYSTGEIFPSKPPNQPPKSAPLPVCTDEQFIEKSSTWKALIESGKQTSSSLIAKLSTKTIFTENQKNTIYSWEDGLEQNEEKE